MKEKIDFLNVYSYSRLEQFKKCPKQYYFSYLDPEIAPIKKQFRKQRDYQTKGQAVHDAITLFYHLPKEERNFKNLKNCLKEAWYSDLNPFKNPPLGELGGFKTLAHERRVYRESLNLLNNFFKLSEINPPLFYLPSKDIKNSYKDYEKLIRPLNNLFFISGKFDQINFVSSKGLEVIDYKTGKGNSDHFQLYFYKLLAELNFEFPVKKATFYYLDSKRKKEFDLSSLSQRKIKEMVLERIKEIESQRHFPCRVSRFCEHCDFLEICPYWQNKKGRP
jgi:CRISPR/Cas system-associated exonuclease Cas4 (RecB family)